ALVGNGRWWDAFTWMLASNGLLGCRVSRREVLVDGVADRRQADAKFSGAVEELNDEGLVLGGRQRRARGVVGMRDVVISGQARRARRHHLFRQGAHGFSASQLR